MALILRPHGSLEGPVSAPCAGGLGGRRARTLFPVAARGLPQRKVEVAVGTPSSSWPGAVPLHLAEDGARHPTPGVVCQGDPF